MSVVRWKSQKHCRCGDCGDRVHPGSNVYAKKVGAQPLCRKCALDKWPQGVKLRDELHLPRDRRTLDSH